jgi:hypothetical protein
MGVSPRQPGPRDPATCADKSAVWLGAGHWLVSGGRPTRRGAVGTLAAVAISPSPRSSYGLVDLCVTAHALTGPARLHEHGEMVWSIWELLEPHYTQPDGTAGQHQSLAPDSEEPGEVAPRLHCSRGLFVVGIPGCSRASFVHCRIPMRDLTKAVSSCGFHVAKWPARTAGRLVPAPATPTGAVSHESSCCMYERCCCCWCCCCC